MRFWDFIGDLREGAAREGGCTCYAAKCPGIPRDSQDRLTDFSCSLSESLDGPLHLSFSASDTE